MDEINTTDDLVSKPINVSLPWDEFHPSDINWLNVFAQNHGTTNELTLLGILPTVSTLLRETESKLFSTHKKRDNMFLLPLGHQVQGKHQLLESAVVIPLSVIWK